MTSTSPTPRLLLAFALLTLLGCKQGEGDTCIEDDDCSGALVCCKASPTAGDRGMCLPEGESCSDPSPDLGPPVDFGTPDDLGASDLGEDLGAEDAGSDDAGSEDAGSDDLGVEDAGSEDAGLEDAGPEDAGA